MGVEKMVGSFVSLCEGLVVEGVVHDETVVERVVVERVVVEGGVVEGVVVERVVVEGVVVEGGVVEGDGGVDRWAGSLFIKQHNHLSTSFPTTSNISSPHHSSHSPLPSPKSSSTPLNRQIYFRLFHP